MVIELGSSDLLAATAAADEMREAAVDAAARIAVGGTAAMIYELAADQILEATVDRPEPLAVVSSGDVSGALTAYALSQLARSRELVHHLAGTVGAESTIGACSHGWTWAGWVAPGGISSTVPRTAVRNRDRA